MYYKLITTVSLLIISFSASAGTISATPSAAIDQVNFFESIGQSFEAIDTNVEAGLAFRCINCSSLNDDNLLYSLYEGVGTAGTLLDTQEFSLADNFSGFFLADFSDIDLVIGDLYSLVVDVIGESPFWGLSRASRNSELSPFLGDAIRQGTAFPDDTFAIQVTGVSVVPVPAAAWLFGSAMLGLLGFSRRKKA